MLNKIQQKIHKQIKITNYNQRLKKSNKNTLIYENKQNKIKTIQKEKISLHNKKKSLLRKVTPQIKYIDKQTYKQE